MAQAARFVPNRLAGEGTDGRRPISADHGAHASLRIIPIACAIGEAAGTAAALCAQQCCTPQELDIRALQEQLVRQGANMGM